MAGRTMRSTGPAGREGEAVGGAGEEEPPPPAREAASASTDAFATAPFNGWSSEELGRMDRKKRVVRSLAGIMAITVYYARIF